MKIFLVMIKHYLPINQGGYIVQEVIIEQLIIIVLMVLIQIKK